MANTVDSYKGQFTSALGIERDFDSLKNVFVAEVPTTFPAERIFDETKRSFDEDELPTVCAEIATTLNALCTEEDFQNWNYDHLEFIIEVASRHGFAIPRHLIDSLPDCLASILDEAQPKSGGCD